MSEVDQLRKRATLLFALALQARDKGDSDYAGELTTLASKTFDQDNEIELRSDAIPLSPATEAPQ